MSVELPGEHAELAQDILTRVKEGKESDVVSRWWPEEGFAGEGSAYDFVYRPSGKGEGSGYILEYCMPGRVEPTSKAGHWLRTTTGECIVPSDDIWAGVDSLVQMAEDLAKEQRDAGLWHSAIDGWIDQPWIGAMAIQATAQYRTRYREGDWEQELRWGGPGRPDEWEAVRITYECRSFLASQDKWSEPVWVDNSVDLSTGATPQTKKTAAVVAAKAEPLRELALWDKARVIVCIEPVVVLEVPLRAYTWSQDIACVEDVRGNVVQKGEYFVVLPFGFDYGSRIPYHDDIMWFSPDLKKGPEAPMWLSDRERQIDIPGGRLVLTHEDDDWVARLLPD